MAKSCRLLMPIAFAASAAFRPIRGTGEMPPTSPSRSSGTFIIVAPILEVLSLAIEGLTSNSADRQAASPVFLGQGRKRRPEPRIAYPGPPAPKY